MKQTFKNPFLHLIIGIIAFLLLYFSASLFITNTPDYNNFNNLLNQKEALAEKVLNELLANQSKENYSYNDEYTKLNKEKGLSFYIIENNKLKY